MSNLERDFRRRLRREATPAEQALWQVLRARRLGAKFRRQRPLGPYVADFYCVAARLVVEVDGSHHLAPEAQRWDAERSAWLASNDIRVLRFTNDEVLRAIAGVIAVIGDAIAERARRV